MTYAKSVKRVLLVEAVVLVLLVVAAELTLRRTAPDYGHELFDAEHTGGHAIALNADGFRGPPVPKERQPHEYRVLAIGDSATFGVSVAAETTWPARLAALRPGGGSMSVVNASFPGAGLKHLRHGLATQWGAYRPDAIVLALTSNHVALAWMERNDQPELPLNQRPDPSQPTLGRAVTSVRRVYKSLYLPAFMSRNVEKLLYRGGLLDHRITAEAPYGAMLAHGYRQLDVPPDLADRAWGTLEAELVAFKAEAERLQTRLIVTMLPARFALSDRASDNEKSVPRNRLRIVPTERTHMICQRHGIEYLDAAAVLRAARATGAARGEDAALYVPGDYTHLDATGHLALAHAVSRTLFADAGSER
jgi:lysophospholipase L1-like esterase